MTQDNNEPKETNEPKKTKPSPDVMAMSLRQREKARRPSHWIVGLVLILLFGVPLGFLVWWFWPAPAPPAALVVAFDTVSLPNKEISLTAQIALRKKDAEDTRLAGWHVVFTRDVAESAALGPAAGADWTVKTQTTEQGIATARKTVDQAPSVFSFLAVYAPEDKFTRAVDHGQIYCWPAQTSLLLVDVEQTLAQTDADAWKTTNIRDIKHNKMAAEALEAIRRKKDYRVVYLACGVDRLQEYLKVRGWVHQIPMNNGKQLPPGPVLGRTIYGNGEDGKTAYKNRILFLQEMFRGKMVGITSDAETAAVFQATGLTTFILGKNKKGPANATPVKNWSKLVEQFP